MINSIKNPTGKNSHFVAMAKDISDIKASEELLKHQAYFDALTGLPNRVLFLDRLTQAIAFADRSESSLGIIFLDMDNFKDINDSLGHDAGDLFLQKVSKRISHACREEDTVARFGGDEFMILMPRIGSKDDAIELARRLKQSVGSFVLMDRYEVHPSMSMGITFYPDDGNDPQLLIKNADMAMYQAKKAGKSTYSLFDENMDKAVRKKMELDGLMRSGLERDEFKIAYQAKVRAADGAVIGAEALVRWEHPENCMVSPAEFIPLAEENGFILELGDWILKTVLNDLPVLKKALGEDFEVAVNLSGRQFRDRKLISRIDRIMKESGRPYDSVNFEITENMAMENSNAALAIVEDLFNLNVRISIDDFGTGYSSLSYLKRFKTHCLKIDKSFIDELPGDIKGAAIVKNIINLGHSLGMSVIAEGVEHAEQLDFLREASCDTIQGYYFSRPLYRDAFIQDMLSKPLSGQQGVPL